MPPLFLFDFFKNYDIIIIEIDKGRYKYGVNFNNIDEINIFNNGDGTYSLEMHISTNTNERATFTIPRARLDINLTSDYDGMSMELKLEGMVSSI